MLVLDLILQQIAIGWMILALRQRIGVGLHEILFQFQRVVQHVLNIVGLLDRRVLDGRRAAQRHDMKAELARLQKEFKDDGQYADAVDWPAGSADGPFNDRRDIGTKTVAEAIAATGTK